VTPTGSIRGGGGPLEESACGDALSVVKEAEPGEVVPVAAGESSPSHNGPRELEGVAGPSGAPEAWLEPCG
jgi:hypothetical protein